MRWLWPLGGVASVVMACSSSETAPAEPIDCEETIGGRCVGVETAVGDVLGPCPCSGSPRSVSGEVALAEALATATAGSCIHVGDGAYGAVTLPAGVQLVGASVDGVALEALRVNAGDGTSACRLSANTVTLMGGAVAELKYVRVGSATDSAVTCEAGSSLRLVGATIEEAGQGVGAHEATVLEIEHSVIRDHQGPGLSAACTEGCNCGTAAPTVAMTDVLLRGNAFAGVSLVGSVATLERVTIADTRFGANFDGGFGVFAISCSAVHAVALTLQRGDSAGLWVSDSDAQLGGPEEEEGIVVSEHLRGIVLDQVSASAPRQITVQNAWLANNLGEGMNFGGGGGVLRVMHTLIEDTLETALPVLCPNGVSGTAQLIGDGVSWSDGGEAHFEAVVIEGSARLGMRIDGPASGSLTDVELRGEEDAGRIVQINYTGGAQPETVGSTPAIQTVDGDPYPPEGCSP